MNPVLCFVGGFILGGGLLFFLAKVLLSRQHIPLAQHEALRQEGAALLTELAVLKERGAQLQSSLDTANSSLVQAQAAKAAAESSSAELRARLEATQQRVKDGEEFVQLLKGEMEQSFGRLANQSLQVNADRFSEQQRQRLNDLLAPFKQQIDSFRQDVSDKFTKEVADRNTLKGELSKMLELNQTLSQRTEALTTALSSQAREQGVFGEDILETILTNAGMIAGEHYQRQFSGQNEDGQRIRPDIILSCPDGRRIVVDSKVSLTAYLRYCNDASTAEMQKEAAREVYASFKAHIDGLSAKKYETLGTDVADFVLMFTPVEGAFTVASSIDSELRYYAFRKKIFLVTPGNLLLVVKLITDLWQRDAVNKDAERMADRALKLYDKARLFLESFEEVSNALGKAQSSLDEARARLTGNGGLVRQGEMLGDMLGSKAKALPKPLVEQAALATGIVLPAASLPVPPSA
jgi:DNA recombination protein RmuC